MIIGPKALISPGYPRALAEIASRGSLGGAGNPGPTPIGAPVLSITSPATNSTPTFSVTFDDLVPAGSVITLQHDTSSSFASPTTITHTITSGEGGSSTVPLGLSPLPNGLRYFRLKVTISGVDSAWSNTVSQTIAAASILSSPTAAATGSTTATLTVSASHGNGTLYWVATTSATPPSATQIKTGKDATGATASGSGSQAVSATGVQTINATGLPVGTTLYAHFMQENNLALQSNVADSASFLTSSNASYSFRNLVTYPGGNTVEPPTYSVDIGTASADRVVLIATSLPSFADPFVLVCNGVTLTLGPLNNTNGRSIAFYYGVVASGSGSVTITATGSGASYFQDRDICVWTLKGLQSNTPRQISNNGNINFSQVTIPVVATDFLFVAIEGGTAPNFAASSTAPPTAQRVGSVEATGEFIIATTNASFVANPGTVYGAISAITFR